MPEVLCSFFSSHFVPSTTVRCQANCLTWSYVVWVGMQRRTGVGKPVILVNSCTALHLFIIIISEMWKEVMIVHHRHKSHSWLWQGRKPRDEVYGEACHLLSFCLLGYKEKNQLENLTLYTSMEREHVCAFQNSHIFSLLLLLMVVLMLFLHCVCVCKKGIFIWSFICFFKWILQRASTQKAVWSSGQV